MDNLMEYGRQNSDVILLLHGGGLSWWNYREVAKLLAERYHVVLPVLDGHGDSNTPFASVEENAARLIAWIDTHYGGQILAIGGLSLGGQIALEMLSQRRDICRYGLIESASVWPEKLTSALIGPAFGMSYGLIRKKWFARLQADYLGIPKELFDDYFRDTCKIKKEDMIAFLKASSLYAVKPALSETEAKVTFVAGSKERKCILDSVRILHEAVPGSGMEILQGMRHGQLSIRDPQRYVRILRNRIESND